MANCGQNQGSSVNPNCSPIADYCNTGCLDITPSECIIYAGDTTECLKIPYGTSLTTVIKGFDASVCLITENLGKIKTDASDECFGYLIDKLEAGTNVVISGTGTGCQKKLRIDAVLGGEQKDELVKVSSIDSVADYLGAKIIGGDCISITKASPGLNEKVQINIDWQCVLNKLAQLPGFCTVVSTCVGDLSPQECPDLVLTSPIVSGPTASITWTSSATQFNVYIDGVLQPGSPQSSTTYTKTGLINGSHTFEVVAICNIGTPKSKTVTFTVNTNCPTPGNITTVYAGGNVTLNWTPGGGINSINQAVKYRLKGQSVWITATNSLAANATSYTINGVLNNRIYEFAVTNICNGGSETDSATFESINIICPTVTFTPTHDTIPYTFPNLGNDVTQYIIELLNSAGTTVINTYTVNPPFTSNIVGTFSGLDPATQYQYRVTIKAQANQKVCPSQFVTTGNAPSCPIPTNLNVTVS